MHAFDWPEQTLKIYIQYSTYFVCNNDLCSAVLTNLLGDVFLSFLPHLSLEEGINLRRVRSAKGSQKSEFYMLAFDWLEQTDKIGCNIFPARMTIVSNFSLEKGVSVLKYTVEYCILNFECLFWPIKCMHSKPKFWRHFSHVFTS